jgi:hypothetical protein
MKPDKTRIFCLISLLLLLCSTASNADNGNLEKINKIKKNHSYVYGEATMTEKPAALNAAMDILEANILEWVTERSKTDVEKIVATDIRHLIDTIFLRRVNMVRAFVYVKKSKLIPVFSKSGLAIIDPSAGIENGEDLGETRVIGSAPEKDVASEKHGETQMNNLKNQGSRSESDADKTTKNKNNRSMSESEAEKAESSDALRQILSVRSFFDLEKVMKPLKQKGVIADYGKYQTLKDASIAYLIIYDPAGNIRAVLGKGSDMRQNLKTQKNDSLRNYRGCGAIWFTLN